MKKEADRLRIYCIELKIKVDEYENLVFLSKAEYDSITKQLAYTRKELDRAERERIPKAKAMLKELLEDEKERWKREKRQLELQKDLPAQFCK